MLSFVTQLLSPRKAVRRSQVSYSGLRFRPHLEGFEDRVVPASLASAAGPAIVAPTVASPVSLLPVHITSTTLNAVTGAVTAVGTIGNQAFTLLGQLNLTQAAGSTTPILDLHLNSIHLNLLGLKVDTSDICLSISATSGQGQLLGNLLTGVANLLNNGGTLPTLGNALAGSSLTGIQNELTQILNQGLGQLFSPTSVNAGSTSVTQSGATNILHLSLGPVNVSLLGLNVDLDNCANGPVTVDITAQSGPGQLLGNLLNSLSHLLDGNGNGNGNGHGHAQALTNALNRVANAIGDILNTL